MKADWGARISTLPSHCVGPSTRSLLPPRLGTGILLPTRNKEPALSNCQGDRARLPVTYACFQPFPNRKAAAVAIPRVLRVEGVVTPTLPGIASGDNLIPGRIVISRVTQVLSPCSRWLTD